MPRRSNGYEPGLTPAKLEALLRNFDEVKAMCETAQDKTGRLAQGEIEIESGLIVNIFDIPLLLQRLPRQQKVAVVLLTLYGYTEKEAAAKMGLKGRASPVGNYKRIGLEKLVAWMSVTEGVSE